MDKRKLKLVLDDINVSKRQIISLQNQITHLNQKLEYLDFQKDEIISSMPEPEEAEQSEEVQFFAVLSSLDSEEAGMKGELEAYRKLKRDLEHEKIKYSQVVKKLSTQKDNLKSRLEIENDLITDLTGKMQQLNEEVLDKEAYLDELKESYHGMIEQQTQIADHIRSSAESALTDMKEQEKEREEELRHLEKREAELKSQLEREKRNYDNAVTKLNSQNAKAQSVSSWRGERSLITGKLKRSKQRLAMIEQNIASVAKREQLLAEKFSQLLGVDDPSGTGDLAKSMVVAELDDSYGAEQTETDEELALEQSYNKELKDQLALIEESFRVFNEHRNETINGLNDELQECTQAGYIRLLKEELDSLQASWK